jgi:hypothetical protein
MAYFIIITLCTILLGSWELPVDIMSIICMPDVS